MEDSDKYITADRLIVLIGEIDHEIQRSPIDQIRLTELLDELGKEILHLKLFPGRILEVLTEVYNSVLRLLAELSLEYLPIDEAREKALHCLQTCIEENRFQWSELVTAHDLLNPLANRSVGLVPAKLGAPAHPTSWQHYLQLYGIKKIFPELDDFLHPIAKYGGRAALLPTLAEGGFDILVETGCLECCLHNDDPKSCDLFPHWVRIE
ncbi:MAG: hypothetical protein HQK96_00920 [Nitrospirae bacterium]|nr:hypothetical protein [Nitrospirota bacterium]